MIDKNRNPEKVNKLAVGSTATPADGDLLVSGAVTAAALNGTLGATTPATVAATTITASGKITGTQTTAFSPTDLISTNAAGRPAIRLFRNTTTEIGLFQGGLTSAFGAGGDHLYVQNPVSGGDVIIRNQSTDVATFSSTGLAVTGNITAPTTPAFNVKMSTNQVNIATTGVATVLLNTERFDQGANFNTGTYTFTAPVTGKYQLSAHLRLDNVDTAATFYQVTIATSNKDYSYTVTPLFTSDASYMSAAFSVLADMDAADTAYVTVSQSGGTSQTDIEAIESYFSGFLAC